MAEITLETNFNPIEIRTPEGFLDSIFWEWRLSSTNGVIGDIIKTPIFDTEALFDGANNRIKSSPKLAIMQVRTGTAAAHGRVVAEGSFIAAPSYAPSNSGEAYNGDVAGNRILVARVMGRYYNGRLTLAADIAPASIEYMRFGFSWTT